MSAAAAITLGITIGSFVITILTIVIKQAIKSGKRDQRIDTVEKEQEKDREKIRALYEMLNNHDKAIGVLESNIISVKETTERIENKLDKIYEVKNGD